MLFTRFIKKSQPIIKKFVLIGLFILIFLYIKLISPTTITVIVPLVILVSITTYYFTSWFSKRVQILTTLFIFTFFILNVFVGFDLINTILLLSFIITVAIFFK